MKKIIVAEDDPGIQDVVQIILQRDGYEVMLFPNGEQLLNNQFEKPDLFLLDKQLSGVDGLDICRFLKGQDATRDIPIVIVSASSHVNDMARAAGADDFLEKPFSMQQLRAIVSRYTTATAG